MASPAPALATLKKQLLAAYPTMRSGSIGIMADARHIAGGTSDHIGGNAIDIPAVIVMVDMMSLISRLLKDPRCHYVIFNRVFYHPGRPPAKYTGSSPHTAHAHMSIIVAKRAEARLWNIKSQPVVVLLPGQGRMNRDASVHRGPDMNVPAEMHIVAVAAKGGVVIVGAQAHGMLHVSYGTVTGWVTPSAVNRA